MEKKHESKVYNVEKYNGEMLRNFYDVCYKIQYGKFALNPIMDFVDGKFTLVEIDDSTLEELYDWDNLHTVIWTEDCAVDYYERQIITTEFAYMAIRENLWVSYRKILLTVEWVR